MPSDTRDEVDVEALQAQIDFSNSVVYDLVSSWMNPTSSSKVSPSLSISRELEEHAKRPPRLGLGASISKTDAFAAREAARLKGKLAGTKRVRDEEKDPFAGYAQNDEDDDESRSAAISKKKADANSMGALTLGLAKNVKGKGRVSDELASENAVNEENTVHGQKIKKHKERKSSQDGVDHNSLATPSKPNPFVIPKTPPLAPPVINLTSPPPTRNTAAVEMPSPPKKKKKRKRKKTAAEPQSDEDEEWHGFSFDETDSFKESEDKYPSAGQDTSSNTHHTKGTIPSTPLSVSDRTSLTSPPVSISHTDTPSRPTKVLNLDGSPLQKVSKGENGSKQQAISESQKKRRRRRRGRKKNNHGEEGL